MGCAVARRFALEGARVAVVEKASDILDGASKANSAILHTGFDAPPGSLELDCIRAGHDEYKKIHRDLGLPLEKTGAFVVAWSNQEQLKLREIVNNAHENGIGDVKQISGKALQKAEPNLSSNAKEAVIIPGEAIIDPWSAPYAYLHQAIHCKGEVFLSCKVIGGYFDHDHWQIETGRGYLKTRYVINCAGLYGDRVDELLGVKPVFTITPRKGQFVVYDKAAAKLVTSVILPVPTARTKGIVVFPTVFGNLAVGPTAQDQESRSDSSASRSVLRELIASAQEKIPALASMPVTATYAGLRPACEHKDYQITVHHNQNHITAGAIRSTGLSSALGIASHVFKLYSSKAPSHEPVADCDSPKANILIQNSTEGLQRDWHQQASGEIVCHCEWVTRREILNALQGPLAARSLAGLKRQTRVTMGRCQGFYCSARLAKLTEGKFETPLGESIVND